MLFSEMFSFAVNCFRVRRQHHGSSRKIKTAVGCLSKVIVNQPTIWLQLGRTDYHRLLLLLKCLLLISLEIYSRCT